METVTVKSAASTENNVDIVYQNVDRSRMLQLEAAVQYNSEPTLASESNVDNSTLTSQISIEDLQLYNLLLEMDGLNIDFLLDRQKVEESLFIRGPKATCECQICFESRDLWLRPCCNMACCQECMEAYIVGHVNEAHVYITCPSSSCKKAVERNEILSYLDNTMINKYEKFLIDANRETLRKTCPRCSLIEQITDNVYQAGKRNSKHGEGIRVKCSVCELEWCFLCHAPYHNGLTCKQFVKGNKQLKRWAAERPSGQHNAQKCPSCKVYIQRVSGCDHMTCSHCQTEFCYLCGDKYRSLRFLGDHNSRLSIFGCKYRFQPENAPLRRFARGSLFAAKMAAVPVVAAGAVAAAAIALPVGSVALAGYLCYKLHKRMQIKRLSKRQVEANRRVVQLCNAGVFHIEHPWRSSAEHFAALNNAPHVHRHSLDNGDTISQDDGHRKVAVVEAISHQRSRLT